MKTIIMAVAILLAGTASFAQAKKSGQKKQHHGTSAKMYACPMHPDMVSNKPGKCPKCGMMMDEKMKKGKMKPDKSMSDMKM